MSANCAPLSASSPGITTDVFHLKSGEALLFKGLSEESLQTLLQYSVIKEYETGSFLLQQGDNPSHLYLVLDGAVKTMRHGENGEEAVIRMLQAGDTFMEDALFMDCPSLVTVQIVDEARLLLIPARIIRALVMVDQNFSLNLLKIATRHYKEAIHQIDSILMKSPVQRIGYYLLGLYLEQDAHGLEIVLPHKKATVASHLGMKPETFSRALNQIRQMGVDIEGDRILLKDSYALCQFCDSDSAFHCEQCDTTGCSFCQ